MGSRVIFVLSLARLPRVHLTLRPTSCCLIPNNRLHSQTPSFCVSCLLVRCQCLLPRATDFYQTKLRPLQRLQLPEPGQVDTGPLVICIASLK